MYYLSRALVFLLNTALFLSVMCGVAALLMVSLPLIGVHLGFWGCYLVFVGFRLLMVFSEFADKMGTIFE